MLDRAAHAHYSSLRLEGSSIIIGVHDHTPCVSLDLYQTTEDSGGIIAHTVTVGCDLSMQSISRYLSYMVSEMSLSGISCTVIRVDSLPGVGRGGWLGFAENWSCYFAY